MERLRSGEALANTAIVVILALVLLPLVVGPFVAASQFAIDRQYADVLAVCGSSLGRGAEACQAATSLS